MLAGTTAGKASLVTRTGHRAKIGDVFRLETQRGFVYLQYTHEHPEITSLIRVLPGWHRQQPADVAALVAGPTRFITFFPLRSAARRPDLLTFIGHFDVPDHAQALPRFRRPGRVSGWRTVTWEIWDGVRAVRVGAAPEEVRWLPDTGVVDPALLKDMAGRDWDYSIELDEYMAYERQVELEKQRASSSGGS